MEEGLEVVLLPAGDSRLHDLVEVQIVKDPRLPRTPGGATGTGLAIEDAVEVHSVTLMSHGQPR